MDYFLKIYDIKNWIDYNLYCQNLIKNIKIEGLIFYAIYNYDKEMIITNLLNNRIKKIFNIINHKKSNIIIKKIDDESLEKLKNNFYKY